MVFFLCVCVCVPIKLVVYIYIYICNPEIQFWILCFMFILHSLYAVYPSIVTKRNGMGDGGWDKRGRREPRGLLVTYDTKARQGKAKQGKNYFKKVYSSYN